MTEQTRYYLELFRWCLHPSAEIPECAVRIRWHDLLRFAKAQAVGGIFWQGIERLGSMRENKPTDDDVMEWMAHSLKLKMRNGKADAALASLTRHLRQNNVAFFVFKGQVVARFYPNPQLRASGDIDFYVFRDDWQRACSLLRKSVEFDDAGSFRHIEFVKGGIPFEMHYVTAEFAGSRRQRVWNETMEQSRGSLETVSVGGEAVPTLDATTNCAYLFIHIYHHFLKEGIGLRQFADWMYFFESRHADIDPRRLDQLLAALSLRRAFRAFGAVLTEVLGMKAELFPYAITPRDKRRAEGITDIIVRYGNFGQHGRSSLTGQGPGLAHSVETGLRSVRHLLRYFWLSPSENLLWLPRLTWKSLMKNLGVRKGRAKE